MPRKLPLSTSPPRRDATRACPSCIVPVVAQQAGSSRSTSPSWSSSMQLPHVSAGCVDELVVDDGLVVVEVEVVPGAVVGTTLEVVVVGGSARLVVVVLLVAVVVETVLVVVVLAAGTAHSSSPRRPSSALKKRTPPTLAGDSG